jgi:hypothetical protein
MSSQVATVPPDARLKDVAAILVEHGINAAPLVDDGNRLLGIVSEADLLRLEAEVQGRAGRHLRPVWADAWSPGNWLQSVGEVHRVNSRLCRPLAAESASPRPGPNVTESAGRRSLPGLVPCGQAYGRTQPLR